MLATDAELDKLRFPLLASPKLDGIRAVVRGGVVYSRSNKPIPNQHVQTLFSGFEYFDGELIVGEPTDPMVYRNSVSGVMSQDGTPDVKFYLFDHVQKCDVSHAERMRSLRELATSPRRVLEKLEKGGVIILNQLLIDDLDHLLRFESHALSQGYEGLILRDPDAPYKQGRSTVKEGYLLKLKRFSDAEAEVIGYEERQQNTNEAKSDERGYTKRSSHKAGKVGRGDLGALILRRPDGAEFAVGTGFTDSERQALWDARDQLCGKVVKYKFFDVGGYDVPRHPVFLGFRDKKDM